MRAWRGVRLLGLSLGLLLGACSARFDRPQAEAEAPLDAIRQAIVLEALGQIGRPYRYGGETPDGFDCSGLVRHAYRQAGLTVPRTTREQHAAGRPVPLDRLRPGDLLFYRFGGSGKIDHVALYLGDGEAVHAPASGKSVIVAPVASPYWMARYVDAVSLLDP
ncbi:MAG TPA: C40 family peptidase [Nevskiaceae bacterium]|nr:C40 family peptidase [Nevskiaceae bacterium]